MPRRDQAAIICSCGWKLGNTSRAAMHEDMEAVEHALIEASVPRLIRHWRLGHRITLREGAPMSYAAVIAKAAGRARDGDGGEDEAPTRLAIGAIEES
jgi:hypothetical protein